MGKLNVLAEVAEDTGSKISGAALAAKDQLFADGLGQFLKSTFDQRALATPTGLSASSPELANRSMFADLRAGLKSFGLEIPRSSALRVWQQETDAGIRTLIRPLGRDSLPVSVPQMKLLPQQFRVSSHGNVSNLQLESDTDGRLSQVKLSSNPTTGVFSKDGSPFVAISNEPFGTSFQSKLSLGTLAGESSPNRVDFSGKRVELFFGTKDTPALRYNPRTGDPTILDVRNIPISDSVLAQLMRQHIKRNIA